MRVSDTRLPQGDVLELGLGYGPFGGVARVPGPIVKPAIPATTPQSSRTRVHTAPTI